MGKPRTADQIAQMIVSLYQEGFGAIEVSRRVSVGVSTVYHVLERAGVRRRFDEETQDRLRAIRPSQREEVIKKYLAGMSMGAIAKDYGCTRSSIRKVLLRQGLGIRPRGQTPKRIDDTLVSAVISSYEKGLSQQEVARCVKQPQAWISRILRENGVAMRSVPGSRFQTGRTWAAGGYVRILIDVSDPLANMANHLGYALEHRLVMARHLGRPLRDDETVHHIDGDRTNNKLENLQLRHGKHGKGIALVCAKCGSNDLVHARLADPS